MAKAPKNRLGRTLKILFEASCAEPVRPGDPDYRLVRARRKLPAEPLPIREIEARLARLKRVTALDQDS